MSEVKRYEMKTTYRGHESWDSLEEDKDGGYVNYEDYAALEAKCAALVVENAKLADCANFYRLGFKPVKGAFGIEWKPTEQLLDDCGNTAIEAIKTPAADAFMDEVRASELDSLAGIAETMLVKLSNQQCSSDMHEVVGWKMVLQQASKRAANIRKVGEKK